MRLPSSILLVVATLAPAGARAQTRIVVGPNVHVSASKSDLVQNEVLLSASPTDPNVLITCTIAGPVDMPIESGAPTGLGDRNLVYVSTDRGKTWRSAGDEVVKDGSGDNHCVIGADGRLHFVSMAMWFAAPGAVGPARFRTRIIVRTSSDSGRTWQDARVEPPSTVDREYLLIDDTDGPYRGRMYISGWVSAISIDSAYMRGGALALWRSIDGGKTFEHPITAMSGDTAVGGLQAWNPVMLSDGTVVFPFFEWVRGGSPSPSPPIGATSTYRLKVIASSDGGASFGKAQQVARFSLQNPSRAAWAHTVNVTAAADRTSGPFRDHVYIGWFQSRDSTHGKATDIMVAHSPDGGKSWSEPVRVNDEPGQLDSTRWAANVMPTIAVNKDGIVGLMWYDRRDNWNDPGYSVRFSASLDGGESWTPSVKLSQKPMTFPPSQQPTYWTQLRASPGGGAIPATVGAELRFNEWLDGGHTAGLAADAAGQFHAVWVDNRTGIHQLWGANVDVNGKVAPNAGAIVAGLEDVAAKVQLVAEASTYDDKTHTITMRLKLRNKSSDTLRAPLKVLVTQLRSQFGIPRVVGADNERDGVGAVWDFSSLMPAGVLVPNSETQPRMLTFRLDSALDYSHFAWARTQSAVRFDARVFAARKKPVTTTDRMRER